MTTKQRRFFTLGVLPLAAVLSGEAGGWSAQAGEQIQKGEMAGYLLVPNEKVPETYSHNHPMFGSVQTPGAPVADVETVTVTLSPALLTNAKLFVRLRAAP